MTSARPQRGSRNKKSEAVEQATAQAAQAIALALPGAFAGDAHAFLMAIYKNPDVDFRTRLDAAKAALPFEKPKLVPSEGAKQPKDEEIPLVERLKHYAREDAIKASAGKVVALDEHE